MANFYKHLQTAHEAAATGDAKQYGVEIAIVTNTKDPDKLGRVKVKFPRLDGAPESNWARVSQPAAGAGRGFYWIPEVEDEVLVAFERGESSQCYVIGALWNGKDKPMDDAYNDDNSTRMIQTKSGHKIVFEDKSGKEMITIADKSGKRTITFDVANKKFSIEAAEGDIEIKAEKNIIISCSDLQIKTDKTGKIDIGSTFDLTMGDTSNIKCSKTLNIKAQRVNIN